MNTEYYYIVRIEQIMTLISALQSLTEAATLLYDNSYDNKIFMPILSKLTADMYILSSNIQEAAEEIGECIMNTKQDDTEC